MKKALKITSIVLIALIVLAMLVILGFKAYDRIKYDSFYDEAKVEFYIPGLMEGYVPQGFDYLEEEKVFLACGYMSNDEASRIYVIDEDGDKFYYKELKTTVGDPYTGHTGGIAYYGDYVYITGDTGIDVFDMNEILDNNGKPAYCRGEISTEKYGINPAFCFVYDEELYVGEFHRDEDYQTDITHHIKTPAGDENKALMISFDLARDTLKSHFGIAGEVPGEKLEPTPSSAYSIPSFVQGACITTDGKIVLSTSWGLSTSNLYIYDFKKINSSTDSIKAKEIYGDKLEYAIPFHYVDSANQVDTIKAPPMAEEIVYMDGKIWIMNESASNKYIFGKFTTGNNLYSVEYPKKAK